MFWGVNAKLERAQEHLDVFKEESERFLQPDSYTIEHHVDYQSGEYLLQFWWNNTPFPLDRWGCLIGDVVHNARSALDHLAYSLNILDTGINPPPDKDKIYFPIFGDATKFRQHAQQKIRRVDRRALAAIETCQPYHARDDPALNGSGLPHPLALIHEIDNTDKHRMIPVVALETGNFGLIAGCVADATGGDIILRPPSERRLVQSATLARYTFRVTGPHPEVHVQANLTPAVAFDENGPFKGNQVVMSLQWALDFIRGAVLRRVADVCFPGADLGSLLKL